MTVVQWLVFGTVVGGFLLIFAVMFALYRDEDLSSLKRLTRKAKAVPIWRTARQVVVFIVGISVVLFGVALLVLPGPAIVVIPAGLAILATEFAWARKLLIRARDFARDKVDQGRSRLFNHSSSRENSPEPSE